MTPLDGELREALSARAATVRPAPDPLAGIERRARGLRRRRTGLAALGAALSVTAVAVAVPTFAVPADRPARLAGPTSSAGVPAEEYGLHADRPWPYRGVALSRLDGLPRRAARVWAERHGVPEDDVTLTPLYGQVYESSGRPELVYLVHRRGSEQLFWGVAQDGLSSTPQEPVDQRLPDGARVLVGVVPGDEVSRVLVVSAPGTSADLVSRTGVRRPVVSGAGGIPAYPLEPATASPGHLEVRAAQGNRVADVTSPVLVPTRMPVPVDSSPAAPVNLLSWTIGGQSPRPADLFDLVTRFAAAVGHPGQPAHYRPLFSDLTESGVRYTVGQAYLADGGDAYDVSWVQDRSSAPVVTVGATTPLGTSFRTFLLPIGASFGTDLLIVVPGPRVGQVSYSADASTPFAPVGTGPGAATLLPRPARTTPDRLEVLDGNGNLDRPLYRGPVTALLCTPAGCP